jgi:hypothetical protein
MVYISTKAILSHNALEVLVSMAGWMTIELEKPISPKSKTSVRLAL